MEATNSIDTLFKALAYLNQLLSGNQTSIELTIVGSVAIHLNGLDINRMTEDIDYINFDATQEFLELTKVTAKKYDLPTDWINSRAKDIEPLPDYIKKKLKTDNRFSNIKLKFIDLDIAIQMKIYAFYIRGLEKDLSDLKVLNPSSAQLEDGISFTKKQIIHHHGHLQLKKDEIDINNLLEYLNNEL